MPIVDDYTVFKPDNIPTLPGKGNKFIDPVFGTTIIQVTDDTDSLINTSGEAQWGRLSNPVKWFALRWNDSSAWRLYSINTSTLAITSVRTLIPPVTMLSQNGAQWDLSGSRQDIMYCAPQSDAEADRKFYEYDADGNTWTPIKDFSSDIRTSGTVTSGASTTVFTATITSPITDLTPHFFVSQKVKFTSGGLIGEEQKVESLVVNDGTITFTMASGFTGTPQADDEMYVRPAGYTYTMDVGGLGRYLCCALGEADGGGQDTGHIIVLYDRTADSVTVRYCSDAEIGSGVHQIVPSQTTAYLNAGNVGLSKRGVWDFGNDSWTQVTENVGHRDGGAGRWVQRHTTAQDPQKLWSVDYDDPNNQTVVWNRPQLGGKDDWYESMHYSWNCAKERPNHFSRTTYITVRTTGFTLYSGSVYRKTSWTSIHADANAPDFARHNGRMLTNMGTAASDAAAAALITVSGQWSYNSTGDNVFVRGFGDADLTDTTNHYIYIQDWRPTVEEVHIITIDDPANLTKVFRVCHTHAAVRKGDESDASRCSLSADGKWGIFHSNWNRDNKRDVFIVKLDLSIAATYSPAITPVVATSIPTASYRPVTIPF